MQSRVYSTYSSLFWPHVSSGFISPCVALAPPSQDPESFTFRTSSPRQIVTAESDSCSVRLKRKKIHYFFLICWSTFDLIPTSIFIWQDRWEGKHNCIDLHIYSHFQGMSEEIFPHWWLKVSCQSVFKYERIQKSGCCNMPLQYPINWLGWEVLWSSRRK